MINPKTINKLYSLYKSSSGVSIDTRNIKDNSIYFSLKGSNFNGNDFALEALNKGATISVVDDISLKGKSDNLFFVEDVLSALQNLAIHHRDNLNIPVIGITGSNGKTTTKNLIEKVLSSKYKVKATDGNLNNHIGVPLSVLAIKKTHQVAVIEMGASAVGEIKFLCSISKPSIGLITNISNAHIEGFKSLDGVVRGKSELFDYLLKNKGKVIINTFDKIINNFSKRFKDPICLDGDNSIINVKLIESEPDIKFQLINGEVFTSNLFGEYNFQNILFAITIGKYFDIEEQVSSKAISDFQGDTNRSEKKYVGSNCLMLDAYNANPTSMRNAIISFSKFKNKNKILILSDMNELGESSKEEHISIANLIDSLKIKDCYLIGENMKIGHKILDNSKWFKDVGDLKNMLSSIKIKNSDILIKGSRSFKLEKLENIIRQISV